MMSVHSACRQQPFLHLKRRTELSDGNGKSRAKRKPLSSESTAPVEVPRENVTLVYYHCGGTTFCRHTGPRVPTVGTDHEHLSAGKERSGWLLVEVLSVFRLKRHFRA